MTKCLKKKLTPSEAKKRFAFRDDIELCLEGYASWKKKAKFFDNISGEFFWSIPYDVLRLGTVHPKRRMEKRKESNLKKYGTEHVTRTSDVKEKTKKTNLQKYGKEFYFQTEDKKIKSRKTSIRKYKVRHPSKCNFIKEKNKHTNLKKYGAENPQQNKAIAEKTQKTLLKKYGVTNLSHVMSFQEKKKKTSIINWGVEHPLSSKAIREKGQKTIKEKLGVAHQMHSQAVKDKIKNTNLRKYGVTHWSKTQKYKTQIKKKKVVETEEWVADWLQEQEHPKPALSTVNQKFILLHTIPLGELEDYLLAYRSNKNNLERIGEKLFETKHFNKVPANLKRFYRPDFAMSSKVFVNVDGFYWHSEKQKDKNYHVDMRKEFDRADLRIFQFREDEIYNKPIIVKSIVGNALKKTSHKIFARKTVCNSISHQNASKFLLANHLMSSVNAKHIGLFFEERLVSVLSYRQRKNICKVERFCSLVNTNVIGGFSKLLKHLERNCLKAAISEIHNWVDLRYGTGVHLLDKGFIQSKETLGWKWTDGDCGYNRLKCRANMDDRKLTQQQHADELKWYKIYDAGQRVYIKYL